MDSDLRKQIGARLLTERIQVKDWNESEAATAAGLVPRTVRRIERGENYEIESLEKYALALGKPLSAWLVDVLVKETQRSAPSAETLAATGTAGGLQRSSAPAGQTSERRHVNVGHGPQGERRRSTDN